MVYANGGITMDKKRKKSLMFFLTECLLSEGYSYEWYQNGQLRIKEKFKKGLRDGKWFKYDPDDQLIKHEVYEDGKHISGDKLEEPKTPSR